MTRPVSETKAELPPRLPVGTRVEVLTRSRSAWVRGFEVTGSTDDGYFLRRTSDLADLPLAFPWSRVRTEADSTIPIAAHTLLTPLATAISALESLTTDWRDYGDDDRVAVLAIVERQIRRTYAALEYMARGMPEQALAVSAAE
ncbi:MAG: hypothetical protein QOE35_2544 [Actinomycetota bacterium]|jgi:hypothetical protein